MPAATETRTFQKAFQACTICLFIQGRVKFGGELRLHNLRPRKPRIEGMAHQNPEHGAGHQGKDEGLSLLDRAQSGARPSKSLPRTAAQQSSGPGARACA
jgi:hypothetical protein